MLTSSNSYGGNGAVGVRGNVLSSTETAADGDIAIVVKRWAVMREIGHW